MSATYDIPTKRDLYDFVRAHYVVEGVHDIDVAELVEDIYVSFVDRG